MKTIYKTNIPNKLTIEYLKRIRGKVYALLPMFEESKNREEFLIYQNNLIQTINGNFDLIEYDNVLIVEILSKLECLKRIHNHDDYKRHIFKICKHLTTLMEGVDINGI